jgi:hypothetical protein
MATFDIGRIPMLAVADVAVRLLSLDAITAETTTMKVADLKNPNVPSITLLGTTLAVILYLTLATSLT